MAHDEKPEIIGRQNEGCIEAQEMSGDTAWPVAFPFDIILPQFELFCFSGQVCRLLQGDPNFRRFEF
jgi:hypothetical protein